MAARKSVPILLLTGFLGGGKTTLLARWLRDAEFSGAFAIINELGEVGLDDQLARTALDAPLLLENGCACCAAGDDLAGALETLFWDRLHRRIPEFTRVVVETTGLADPAPILDLIANRQLVAERYFVEGVVTVADARLVSRQLVDYQECRAQMEAASVVVLSKTDLASADEIAAARAVIARERPGIPVLLSRGADLPAAALLAAVDASRVVDAPAGAVAAHTPGVTTAFADLPHDVDPARVVAELTAASADFGPRLLRLKGLVRLAPDSRWAVVQVAPNRAPDVSLAPAVTGARAGLTIIARDIPAGVIAARLRARLAGETTRAAYAG